MIAAKSRTIGTHLDARCKRCLVEAGESTGRRMSIGARAHGQYGDRREAAKRFKAEFEKMRADRDSARTRCAAVVEERRSWMERVDAMQTEMLAMRARAEVMQKRDTAMQAEMLAVRDAVDLTIEAVQKLAHEMPGGSTSDQVADVAPELHRFEVMWGAKDGKLVSYSKIYLAESAERACKLARAEHPDGQGFAAKKAT